MAIIPISIGIIVWIIIAKPFILLLFGTKYLEAVPIFQVLAMVQIPALLSNPASSAIIYAMKKTVFIGIFSTFQLVAILGLNFVLIPKFGIYGPILSIGIINTFFVIYSWTVVIKHYWVNK